MIYAAWEWMTSRYLGTCTGTGTWSDSTDSHSTVPIYLVYKCAASALFTLKHAVFFSFSDFLLLCSALLPSFSRDEGASQPVQKWLVGWVASATEPPRRHCPPFTLPCPIHHIHLALSIQVVEQFNLYRSATRSGSFTPSPDPKSSLSEGFPLPPPAGGL